MSNIDTYLKNSRRGEFEWNCVETTDGYGMGGVAVEEVSLKGRAASITKLDIHEYEIDIELKHPTNYKDEKNTYEIIDFRSSRKYARILAERLINKDIEKDLQ